MGTWGPAIFSDDTAEDVRTSYRELLEDGNEGKLATLLLLAGYADLLNDPDDGPVLWLALAAIQWQLGRLEDKVKERALNIIDTGAGLDRWEESGASVLKARRNALAKLREKLMSPQPLPKKIRKPWGYETDLSVGDAISYRLNSGEFVILRVIGIDAGRRFIVPIFELCDWVGKILPSVEDIERLPYFVEKGSMPGRDKIMLFPHKKNAYPAEKITIIARNLRVRPVTMPYSVSTWEHRDQWLNRVADQLSRKLPASL